MRKDKLAFFLIGFVCVAAGLLYYIIFTTPGSQYAAGKIISGYADYEDANFKNVEGNFISGITFRNLELKDIKGLPEGTTLKIQRLFLNLTSLNITEISAEIENTRLKLPDSEPIVISGTLKEQQLDLNIYSKGFTVTEVLSYLPDLKKLIPIKGDVSDIDLFVSGNYLEPVIKGNFTIEKFLYKGFLLTGAPLSVDVQLKDVKEDIKLYGTVSLEKGDLQTKKTLVKLERGSLNFLGPWDNPGVNLKGSSKVERTKISISLKGTIEEPDLTLTSDPAYSSQKLMVMLATGKSWQSVEDSIGTGLNSAALTKDFIDYFFFAGKTNQFAKKFGISDFSVSFDQNSKGIAAKKELSDKLEVGYGIEQTSRNGQAADVSQKIEGEYKVSERISVGLEREMKKKQAEGIAEEQQVENNDKVLLKYKKSF